MYRSACPLGTKIQDKSGRVKVKIEKDNGEVSWQAEARRMWELYRGPLQEGDRVFHLNGRRDDDRISNLAKIHFNLTPYKVLAHSRVLYMPTIHTIDKKTKKVLVHS